MRNAALRLKARLAHASARAGEAPIAWTLRQIATKLASFAAWLLLLPLGLVLHLAGARRLPVITQRIGHFATEVDCFLKERALGYLPARRWFIAAPPDQICNAHLLRYWKAHIRVIEQPWRTRLLQLACRPPLAAHDIADYALTQHGAARYGAINAEWGARGPLLALSDEDREWGASMLAQLGVPPGAWFVCLHPRTPGFAAHDDSVHSYRNSDPARLVAAIATIARRGGWCVLMGDASSPRLPPAPNLVDYAHHPLRSERLDIVLCASCRFFLGSSSGLFVVSTVFGVPVALANMAPLSALPYAPGDLFIPKLYRARDGRLLTFAEILAAPLGGLRHSRRFEQAGVELIENSAEELVDLVEDMLGGVEAQPDPFRALLQPHHYGYASAARLSPRFVARHRSLLPQL